MGNKRIEDSASLVNDEDCGEVYVAGPIGIEGGSSLEEWYELRKAMFEELQQAPIPPNLIDAVRRFRPHASVTWLNQNGELAARTII
jgi:hypothetical protein